MTSENTIQCAEHGEACITYICGHLSENPAQQWYCDFPTEDNRWPDAWCPKCEKEFLKEGGWNEKNEDCLNLKIICNHCYESAIAASIDALAGNALASWGDAIADCNEALHQKQALLETNFSISKHKHWDYDQATKLLAFSNDGVLAVTAEIELIGSLSTQSNTWLWAWANFNMLPNIRTRIKAVRNFGEEKRYPRLTVPKWSADEFDGWEMSGIATHILDAHGVYRVPSENGFLFMAITDIRNVQ